MRGAALLALLLSVLAAHSAAPSGASAPPAGFVALREAVPGVRLAIGYHGADNFTGAPLPGYGSPEAWLRAEAAASLARVAAALAPEGLGLLILDAYRPARASAAMVAWAARTGKGWVLEQGYVAARSGHNHGHTVDLTLFSLETGAPLDMGGAWDTFSSISHTRSASGAALEHRLRLQAAMVAEGWQPYSKEWWHFRYPLAGTRARDVPYGCFEPPEGAWTPPTDWRTPTYTPPAAWPTPLPGCLPD